MVHPSELGPSLSPFVRSLRFCKKKAALALWKNEGPLTFMRQRQRERERESIIVESLSGPRFGLTWLFNRPMGFVSDLKKEPIRPEEAKEIEIINLLFYWSNY